MKNITNNSKEEDDMVILVEHKKAYGKDFFYPRNLNAKVLSEFARCETFTKDQLKRLKTIGYSVELKPSEEIRV